MTNEELAEKIGKGGNDDLLSVLWEQVHKYFEMYAGKYFRRFRDKCDNAGVTFEDLVQECYFAMLDGIKAYNKRKPEQAELTYITYCKLHIRNRFVKMLGYRGHNDPLNSDRCSLDAEIPNSDTEDITLYDVLEDPEAERPFRDFEDRSFYRSARRFIRKTLENGGKHEYRVIDCRYFRGLTNKEISNIIGLSPARVQQIEKEALARLKNCYELQQFAEYSPYRHIGLENFKHCNIMYKSFGTIGYVDVTKLQECRIEEDLSFWRGKRVWIGLDLSLSEDNTAVAMVTRVGDTVFAKVWGFIPTNRIDIKSEKEKVDYRRFIREGSCFDCGDEIIDYGFIEKFILDLPKKYGVKIMQVGYDKWNAISTVQKLEAEALSCVEIRQHSSILHKPTKLLKEKILSKMFRYDANRLLEINFMNARCTEDTNLNKYVNKKKSDGKVDLVVALINAMYLLQQNMETSGWVVQVIKI